MAFLERILRAMTPGNQRDWLAQHDCARQVKRQPVAGGLQFTYEDAGTHERAVYTTDPLGNVTRVEVQP